MTMSGKGSIHPVAPMLYPGNVTRLAPQPRRSSSGLGIFNVGDKMRVSFRISNIDPVLQLSLEESCAKNFLFASLVKTSAVSHKRVFASALPVRQVIRQTPVGLAPAELNPFLPKVDVFVRGVSRQKGTSPEVSGLVIGKKNNLATALKKATPVPMDWDG